MKKKYALTVMVMLVLFGCVDNEDWFCREDGDLMYSISSSGAMGSADKGCSCGEIREFERRKFGEVDEQALRNDFDCE